MTSYTLVAPSRLPALPRRSRCLVSLRFIDILHHIGDRRRLHLLPSLLRTSANILCCLCCRRRAHVFQLWEYDHVSSLTLPGSDFHVQDSPDIGQELFFELLVSRLLLIQERLDALLVEQLAHGNRFVHIIRHLLMHASNAVVVP